jgi:DNA topoisomerase I
MKLIIVESPTKAKTLNRYLGSGYEVEASMGHIRDLPKSKLCVDVDNDFKPTYEVVENKVKTLNKIIKLAKKAEAVIIATDPDREGEAIGYHVKYLLQQKLKNAKKKPIYVRATFHEITKSAIEQALKKPEKINLNLVDAQQARRVLDRLVGYKLSPVLWKKVRRGLSAGRVQSVSVKLIVEREKEIEAFKPDEYWELGASVKKKSDKFSIDLFKIDDKPAKVSNKKQADTIISTLKKAKYEVIDVSKREVSQNPMPPFITSTMQRAASNLFGWSSKQTMRQAQQLYEHGFITYHRTDSLTLSSDALKKAEKYIKSEFGSEYYPEKVRVFKTKSKLAQEAHEAIRPTKISALEIVEKNCGQQGKKLYQLIFNRFIASQMEVCRVAKTTILVKATDKYLLKTVGEIQLFDGWRKIFGNKKIDEDRIVLPELTVGDILDLIETFANQKFTQPPTRYSESTLIKALEQRGIGRPSTYAPTISTIQDRRYIEKIERKFHPTSIGMAVTEFLAKNFDKVMDYDFTAQIEEQFDDIANGKTKWEPMISKFYKPFIKKVVDVEKNAERVKIEVEKTGEKCPECKKGELVIRMGRFGKFISCSEFPECKFKKNYIEKVDNLKCPDCKEGDVILRRSRKGRQFYGCSKYPDCKWASWTKPVDKNAEEKEEKAE